MVERKKIMNAKEMEQWLVKKGAVPISKEIEKEPWFREMSKLPPCLKPGEVVEASSSYQTKKNKSNNS